MNIGVKSWLHAAGVLMLVVSICAGAIMLSTCDALTFVGLEDGNEDNNAEPSAPELPSDNPDATVHIYPPKMFTHAVVHYTNGSYSDEIEITAAFKTSFFSIPDSSSTIYELILKPGNISVLIGRKPSDKFHLEFDQSKNVRFRTDQEGNQLYPVPIGTYAELIKIYEMQNKDNWAKNAYGQAIEPEYYRAHFSQQDDIDLFGDIANKAKGTYKAWNPIGIVDDDNPSKNSPFMATYDGTGKKLYNLSIETNAKYQGLFAMIGSGGIVTNLNVAFAFVEAGSTSAILCAMNAGKIENCIVSDSGLIKAYVAGGALGLGGLCGTNLSGGRILGSGFLGTVTATGQSGGICGVNNGVIEGVYFYGSIQGAPGASFISTIAGINESYGSINFCYWYDTSGSAPENPNGNQLSQTDWPVFPEFDLDPEAGWAAYTQRGSEYNGRWKNLGTPSNSPQRSALPKLWWQ